MQEQMFDRREFCDRSVQVYANKESLEYMRRYPLVDNDMTEVCSCLLIENIT